MPLEHSLRIGYISYFSFPFSCAFSIRGSSCSIARQVLQKTSFKSNSLLSVMLKFDAFYI